VDLNLTKPEKIFTVKDHVGAMVCDREDSVMYGVSWEARRITRWTFGGMEQYRYNTPSHFLVYQDAKYVGDHLMLASGMSKIKFISDGQEEFWKFGSMALVELATGKIVNEIPVLIYCGNGCVITHNPMDVMIRDQKLQFIFTPDDNETMIYIYECR